MSFVYPSGANYAPLPYQYFEPVAQQRSLRWWHIALLLISIVMATVGLFARLVLSNLQPLNAEISVATVPSTTPSLPSAPATLPLQVTEPQSAEQNAKLQADIDAWLSTHASSDWAVDVRQLDGDLSASSKASESYQIASLYKLFLLQPLASKIPSSGWDAQVDGQTYKQCIDLMLRLSDNSCAEAIGSRLGWSYIDKQLRSLGYGDTHLSVGDATGTAHDTSLVLQNLYEENGFDSLARELELAALAAPKKAEGIRNSCSGCTVYNKVGYIRDYKHDAAIVESNGHVYSIVILSRGGSWKQMSELMAVIQPYL